MSTIAERQTWKWGRFVIYLAGLAAGGLAMAGYADFDSATWELDIRPFNLKEFLLTSGTTFGNAMAMLAVWKNWGRK